jgi:hypothetical protein
MMARLKKKSFTPAIAGKLTGHAASCSHKTFYRFIFRDPKRAPVCARIAPHCCGETFKTAKNIHCFDRSPQPIATAARDGHVRLGKRHLGHN